MGIDTAIAAFLADKTRSTLELPHMTAAQRKYVKNAVQQHPELASESYGFGQERQLHLFKKSAKVTPSAVAGQSRITSNAVASGGGNKDQLLAASPVKVKNTFIDDWSVADGGGSTSEPVLFRSMPPSLSPNVLLSSINEEEGRLESCSARQSPEGVSADRSTAASSSSSSPKSSTREPLQKSPGLPTPTDFEVRNTFIHFESVSADERAVQSMPHGMFD